MIAYGVASRAMYSYNNDALSFDGRSIFRNIIYPTYYLLYEHLENELADLDGKMRNKRRYASNNFIFSLFCSKSK